MSSLLSGIESVAKAVTGAAADVAPAAAGALGLASNLLQDGGQTPSANAADPLAALLDGSAANSSGINF